MAHRTTCTATLYDADGFPFIMFRGNAQDVGDAASIYVSNVADPLRVMQAQEIELLECREEEGES